jgi:hypothetical protein
MTGDIKPDAWRKPATRVVTGFGLGYHFFRITQPQKRTDTH